MRKIIIAAALTLGTVLPFGAVSQAATHGAEPPHVDYSFDGLFGTYDRNQLKRGFQVYKEVCSSCHSLKLVAYRNLKDPGGPEFTEDEAKALAAEAQIPTLDEAGEATTRKGTLADHFAYQTTPQEHATLKGAYGSVPPDLSLMAKGRENGPVYIHALLAVGYDHEPPAGTNLPTGTVYNTIFPGGVISMPKPLTDGQVAYAEKDVPQTVDQYAKDVAAFLMWTAEPKLEARHRMGFGVILFLSIMGVLFFLSYRRVWKDVDH